MPAIANHRLAPETSGIAPERLRPNPCSISLYGDPSGEVDDLIASVREHGILVPLVVAAPGPEPETWEVVSGHRRLACARALGMTEVPCQIRRLPRGTTRRTAVLEYNRQRRKTFSQLMREADALEELVRAQASARRLANPRAGRTDEMHSPNIVDCRNSDARAGDEDSGLNAGQDGPARHSGGRTDAAIARHLGMGGKDL